MTKREIYQFYCTNLRVPELYMELYFKNGVAYGIVLFK